MAASPSVLRHSQESTRKNAQSLSHNPSSSPVPPVALKTSTLHSSPLLNIFQGPPPSQSLNTPSTHNTSVTLTHTVPTIEQYPRHKFARHCHLTTSPSSSQPSSSQSSRSSSLSALAGKVYYNTSENNSKFLQAPEMLSSQKGSNHGCLPLTSPLAPPSLVDTSVSAPPPSTTQSSRKKAKTRLHLSALPRFPPPPSHTTSPPPPNSMMAMNAAYQYNTQAYVTAQQQLQYYQKDMIQQATRGTLSSHLLFPVSPRLIPLGSPGPVTPLTLEESSGGYLTASSTSSSSPGSSINVPFLPQREMDKLTAIAAAQT